MKKIMDDERETFHVGYEQNVNQDELILQQQRLIEKEISENITLVGESETISSLLEEYSGDAIYSQKVKDLSSKYQSMRRTRPDGNCFYRAFVYAYFEQLLLRREEFDRIYKIVSKSKDKLVTLGFPQFTIEDFHETFMDVLRRVGGSDSGSFTHDDLHKLFNEQDISDYIVVYLRLITSGQLQEDEEFYKSFIEGDRPISDFCHQEVEPMYKESDHIHIIALTTALGIGVRVRYMDRGGSPEVIAHDFPEGREPSVHLLYRPGHYDILYPI